MKGLAPGKRHLVTSLAALFLVACASSPKVATCDRDCHHNQRRLAYVEANPQLDQKIKSAILVGRAALGMTKADMIAALGAPDQQVDLTQQWVAREQWIYYNPSGKPQSYFFQFERLNSWKAVGMPDRSAPHHHHDETQAVTEDPPAVKSVRSRKRLMN